MADPWLTIIGWGEDGLDGLGNASRTAIKAAEVVFGGPRHLSLVDAGDRGREWPVPFSVAPVLEHRGRKVVVLASGDPFWHGAGGTLSGHVAPGEWVCHPAPSTFALAASRMGWKIEETVCMGLHAAPFSRLRPVLGDGVQAICLLRDGQAPEQLSAWLTEHGFGKSPLVVMEALGGTRERVRQTKASDFSLTDVEAPVAVAISCHGKGLSQASGLPDDLFASDGQITKRPVRALTLSALSPRPGELLWDIGGGSGSISVEWCLAAPASTAIAFEPRQDRCANIRSNAEAFGVEHRLTCVGGKAPDVLEGQATPDCVFVGGGNSRALIDHLWDMLRPGTRIVANAVTLETEALLTEAQARLGGHLLRVELAEAAPLGSMRGWDRARPVVQWSVVR